ncbi:4-amino-4-deoxy-L-arabinose transferase-like glycosyltransferase [Dysgonomonas sp. PFB1-18]|uniref:ArnT family glycosyltransferase n=1 Tax=unclassified Dysgonomonas TaxID=2630389 RepID=UPI0024739F03|nr:MULTISPECIES: glycosyltransferase family 39 protein [unclassified Dysgonomonas]MDL2303233.1 glycosyltransferase family 39 protein [Dysgonomonas sp. OttesenSCG-928-D17]MDH6307115.1 4-amino-4-deoxy-L-arabinose transferase-like glycosyltransferase [Dysgonomonas sp. PF1-14]MDH6337034.1 4-amino-4-deoxy-L-arabinose transferase-like glycosyltransferase [Dysgonomonas sp. PF1-16]MDH6381020.1 4-amino-4-deoxy-L-arabinose transferase-like glycosyltransferase [Dysgonomonas sp. PFB1-18]MDH6396401.1 4-ami
MRKSHFLQTLYLQKPLLLILLIAIISTLPWIGMGEFYTKGEPREAALAISMIEKGEWVIPSNYADEFAYKPPLNHWLIAGFSLAINKGEVTPFTSRLPSTLAFIAMIGVCFMFFARRRPVLEAFVSCLILITCFELHRAAMTTRIDMLLTALMVCALIQMYTWYEKRRFGQLLSIWLLMSFATLAKGPVGILVPCMIFGTYLLIQKDNFFKATLKCLIIGVPALIIPFIWYYAAYQIQGEAFLDKVFAENFGRFLSMKSSNLDITYELGVENPWYYYPITLVAGFLPWTLLLAISLFFIKYKKPAGTIKSFFQKILSMDKVHLFSLSVIVVSLIFFTIPTSKRSVYIMLVYPFIAIFIARFFIYLTEMKPLAIRISTSILVTIGILMLIIVGLAYTGIINVEELSHHISKRERTLRDIKLFSDMFINIGWNGLFAILVLLCAVANSIYLLRKKINVKILMAGFGLMFALNIFLDVYLLAGFKDSYSAKPFAEKLSDKYELRDNVYVTNYLKNYRNLYGLNFYLHNNFRNIATEQPEKGFFVALRQDIDRIQEEYNNYNFTLLESSDKLNDCKDNMLFFKIEKK